ncbi:GNAT family N-acetyltransferase [Clostridium folliculivorans]|uniref:Acetyltransferase n=1 Tax=Clostridium folliculivorans TaxID=2886038 RepID=A0A9W5Y549_9CLOT|nr:GNAT family N-acetyltransferase [Clostridium folliculivorans]GKU26755.1 acetyltransferase [Clostridium folliculivorans]GKU31349.1 acetyltransferase [Clostridium folliculivorans]
MIKYKNCLDVTIDDIFKAFQDGFSDYIIKLNVNKEDFEGRFFGAEGNSKEYSFVVYDSNKPVGLMLGGIKVYDGVKTLRCGALAIHPSYRGGWISKRLFQLHQEIAKSRGCSQLFLEVIVGNDRAISFYNKVGYSKIYDISFYSNDNVSNLKRYHNKKLVIKDITLDKYREICDEYDGHISWQNDYEFLSLSKDTYYYGGFIDDVLVSGISINKSGKISFIYVAKNHRFSGVGSSLINYAVKELGINMITTSFVNNSQAFGFLVKNGFKKMPISQYEMYKIL